MAAAGRNPAGDERGAPRLLQHFVAYDRMTGDECVSARARLDLALGGELAGLLCRALTRGPRRPSLLT